MFSSSLKSTLRQSARFQFARLQSTSSYQAKATSLLTKSVYYLNVTKELAKQIYLKEKLSPPTLHEIQGVYDLILTKINYYGKHSSELGNLIKSFNQNDLILYGSYFIQLSGLFALGEIIGRRHIVGYAQN